MPQANWLDRAISYVSPRAAERRTEARTRMQRAALTRNVYEAASVGRRTQGWRAVGTDANVETRTAGGRLRDVARDMVRNNAHAASAKLVITNNAVGAGLLPRVMADRAGRAAQIKALLTRHFDTTDIDADGRLNLYGLQALALGTIVEAGEVLIRKRIRRPSDGFALPFQIQVLEPDFLDTSIDGPQPNGNYAIQGVEFNAIGRRVAYYLFDQHPGSLMLGRRMATRGQRVSADFVAHVYRVDRPGQVRGVSWFAPVILRIRDFADYTDAQLIRQKIAACFAAFITTDEDGDFGVPNADGTIQPADPQGNYPVESFEPGMVERLRSGESVSFATPPTTQDFGPYASATLHEVAAGLGIPFETLTGNLGEVSFISGRLGRINFRSNVDAWRWNMIVPQMLDPLAAWTLEAAAVATGSTEPFRLGWTPPRWEMLNPAEEIAAAKDAIRSGLSWLSEEQRVAGYDPEDVRAGIIEDLAWLDANEVTLDVDPRRVTNRGVAQKNADPNAPDPADTRR
ncbi:phage portal protein [Chelatococcus reniformis]|uniref:Phage portal protein n=1 Tax=Chelatococcus reniformis TaxID=1494448 RepID=A0A916XG28_9HYPH|nr:phage portal protein [Chelatococcus reniformis]GGC70740.1 phage portal protein [Chelatococcus reniformis]